MVAMFQAACISSGRQGQDVETPPFDTLADQDFDFNGSLIDLGPEEPEIPSGGTDLAVPEHSLPGESQSHGKAEASVKIVIAHARTIKLALEARLGAPKLCHAPTPWLPESSSTSAASSRSVP